MFLGQGSACHKLTTKETNAAPMQVRAHTDLNVRMKKKKKKKRKKERKIKITT